MPRTRRLRRALYICVVALSARWVDAVVINEIHYDPPEGSSAEFVELYNDSGADVSIGGWNLSGVGYYFPAEATIAAGGYVIVCKNAAVAMSTYEIGADGVFGDYAGRLSGGGERISLLDAGGTLVDSVRYDDDPPWDTGADGGGSSLQRLCTDFDGEHPGNWRGDVEAGVSPLAPTPGGACPPPNLKPPAIAITEINYHPPGDQDLTEEFVELRNNTGGTVDLQGYAFADGIEFSFDESTPLAAGAYIVVCRDRQHMLDRYGVENSVGDYAGQLSNSGERITLVDADGAFVDSVRYRDSGDWPSAADGLGYSLEKLVPTAVSDDPASWREAAEGTTVEWRRVTLRGLANGRTTRIRFYINGEGEFRLDNISIRKVDAPDVELIPNGTFDENLDTWELLGTHTDSTWMQDGGPDGSGALRLISNGRGSLSNAARLTLEPPLEDDAEHIMTFDYLYVQGSTDFNLRVTGGSPTRGLYFSLGQGPINSAGEENSRRLEHLPPFVDRLQRFPVQPKADEPIWLTARVRGERDIAAVRLHYHVDAVGESATSVEMFDDGAHRDGLAGDGVYGAQLPAQVHNTVIVYRMEAEDADGSATVLPSENDPTGYFAFYVNDNQPASPFPVYTLLWNHKTLIPPRTMRSRLSSCAVYVSAAFAYEGDVFWNIGLRRRGGSVCGDGNVIKPYMKLKFNRGRLFENQRKVNLQSIYTDKSLIRDYMSWQMFERLGHPGSREYYNPPAPKRRVLRSLSGSRASRQSLLSAEQPQSGRQPVQGYGVARRSQWNLREEDQRERRHVGSAGVPADDARDATRGTKGLFPGATRRRPHDRLPARPDSDQQLRLPAQEPLPLPRYGEAAVDGVAVGSRPQLGQALGRE